MKRVEKKDLSERKDSASDEGHEDPGFWSMIHGMKAYFLPKDGGATVLSISDYRIYKSGVSLYDLSLVSKVLMDASGEVNLEISEVLVGLSGKINEICVDY